MKAANKKRTYTSDELRLFAHFSFTCLTISRFPQRFCCVYIRFEIDLLRSPFLGNHLNYLCSVHVNPTSGQSVFVYLDIDGIAVPSPLSCTIITA